MDASDSGRVNTPRTARLDRDVELAPEAAADRGRHDVHLRRAKAEDPRDLVAVHVGRLRAREQADALPAVLDERLGVPGLGFDVGVFDVARGELALGNEGRRRDRAIDVALRHAAADEHVVGLRSVDRRGRGERRVELARGCERLPLDGDLALGDARDGVRLADEAQHRLAAEAHLAVREHRLVFHVRENAEAVDRHVACRNHGREAGMLREQRCNVADAKPRARARRPDGSQPERILRSRVGAVALRAGQLGDAVGLHGARADRPARLRRGDRDLALGRREHRLDDLAVAGAAAQHAAERVLDVAGRRVAIAREEIARRHEHARRADAALRRAVREECLLQPIEPAIARERFDRRDPPPVDLRRRNEAGAHLFAIEEYRARAAIARIAADLGAGEAQTVAEEVGETLGRGRQDRDGLVVHDQHDVDELGTRRVHDQSCPSPASAASSARPRRTSSSAASRR